MKQFSKQNHRCRKQIYSYQREMMVERDNLGGWNQHRHPYIQKAGNQEGPTVQHRKLYSIHCNDLYGKEPFKKKLYIYINVHLKQTQQFKSTILQFKIKIK